MDILIAVVLGLVFLAGAPLGLISFFQIRGLKKTTAELQKKIDRLTERIVAYEEAPASAAPFSYEEEPSQDQQIDIATKTPEDFVQSDEYINQQASEPTDDAQDEAPVEAPESDPQSDEADPSIAAMSSPPPASKAGAESTIGGKLSVWIGGITMALGSLFLVRFAIESGYLGPSMRVILGVLFGLGVCTVGETLRRRDRQTLVAGYEWASVPAILTAVGTFAIFAALYAAHSLYDLIGPAMSFVALGMVAVITLVAALLHGPGLAAFGLLGSLAVPLLISSDDPNLLVAALYVLIVGMAAILIARLRYWRWLAIAASIGLLFYAFTFELFADFDDRFILFIYLVASTATVIMTFVTSLYPRNENTPQPVDWVATALLSVFALPWLMHSSFTPNVVLDSIDLILVAGAPFLLAYFYPAIRFALFVPVLVALSGFADWGIHVDDLLSIDPPLIDTDEWQTPGPFRIAEAFSPFTWMGVFMITAGFAAGSIGTVKSASRAVLASAATKFILLTFIILYARLGTLFSPTVFALSALVLFLIFRVYSEGMARRLAKDLHGCDGALSAWLIGSLIALGLAATIILDEATLTVALGLLVPAFALTYWQYPLKVLRALTPLAVTPYGLRLLDDPFIASAALGSTPLFNVLTYGYGIPMLGFVFSAFILSVRGEDLWSRLMQAIAIAGVVTTATMVTLHAIDPEFRFISGREQLLAAGSLTLIGGGISLGMMRLFQGAKQSFLSAIGTGLSLVGVVGGAAGLFILTNPFFTGASIGPSYFFNAITFAYGLPFLLYSLICWTSRGNRPAYFTDTTLAFAAGLFFCFVNLTIRHVFNPTDIQNLPAGEFENYTYSVVWLVVGITVLAIGLAYQSRLFRMASGVIIGFVVLKVFLVDMSELEGILRAVSFISLGAVLIAIGYFYQRILKTTP